MEVGTFAMDIYVSGQKIPESPLFFKVYDSSLIRVSEIRNGIVGQPSQFRLVSQLTFYCIENHFIGA